MKIKTWIRYEESHTPKGSKKTQYRDCSEFIYINLREAKKEDLSIAFRVNLHIFTKEIYLYKGSLYHLAPPISEQITVLLKKMTGMDIVSPLDYLKFDNLYNGYQAFDYERIYKGKDTSRKAIIQEARKELCKYLWVDGRLYEKIGEPRYVVETTKVEGTTRKVVYEYDPEIKRHQYFNALQGDDSLCYAFEIANENGEVKNDSDFDEWIEVLIPEAVKIEENPVEEYLAEKLQQHIDEVDTLSDIIKQAVEESCELLHKAGETIKHLCDKMENKGE